MTTVDRRSVRTLAQLLTDEPFTVGLWLLAVMAFVALKIALAVLGRSDDGVWELGGGLVAGRLLFAHSLGNALILNYLPLYVTNGKTRRQFMHDALLTAWAYTAAGAAAMAVGLLVEAAVHRALGWPYMPDFNHLFQSPSQFWLVFTEYWLLFTLWAIAGAMVAAGTSRGAAWKMLGVALAVVLVGLAESAVGTRLPFDIGFTTSPPVAVAVLICAASAGVGLAFTWCMLRNVPINPSMP